jgi:uncharacterized protein YbjT (DUF2867 family)
MPSMPVMVVGADTPAGSELVDALLDTHQEVRAFVSDPAVVAGLRSRGVKVATGDVSDPSHVSAACTDVFTAILVTAAAHDARARSFADHAEEVIAGWVEAVEEAHVTRVIWLTGETPPRTKVPEEAVVDPGSPGAISEVVRLDEAGELPGRE